MANNVLEPEKNPEDIGYNRIDLFELIGVMWKHKLIIIACALVAALISYVKVAYMTPDTYTATAMLYVSNKTELLKTMDVVSQTDITTARTISESCRVVFLNRSFLKDVSNATGDRYSWQSIRGMLSISSASETEFLNISVTAGTPDVAYDVANAIVDQAPKKFLTIFKGGEIEIVDKPEFPAGPNGNGMSRKLFLGFLIGCVLGAAICFAIYFFDTTIRKSEDVAKRYNISLLGELAQ